MNIEEIYQAEQEFERYKSIMGFKEILNQEDYDFCFSWDHEETKMSIFKIGEGRYLNLNLYSERDKEEFDLRKEMGI